VPLRGAIAKARKSRAFEARFFYFTRCAVCERLRNARSGECEREIVVPATAMI
jgi:hypothetical protein